MTEETATPLVVAMAPEYRRCVIYVLVGLAVIPFVTWWVRDLRPPGHRPDLRVTCAGVGLLALGAVSILRWRLRVDERGISRRRLSRWHLYAWEEFARGHVREGVYRDSFVFPDRRPWNRNLTLEFLRSEDRAAIRASIERVWVRPPRPEVPADLGFRLFFRKVARLTPAGLTITHRGEDHAYAWAEVRALKIRRSERARRDFASLELELPDRTIKLLVRIDHGRAVCHWSALPGQARPDPETLATAFLEYVPAERVVITSLAHPPATWAEWEDRRALLERRSKELRDLKRVMAAFTILFLAVLLYAASDRWAEAAAMLVPGLVMFVVVGLVVRFLVAEHASAWEELETQVPGRTASASTDRDAGGIS